MAEKKRYGFVGTAGLVLMLSSGTFASLYSIFLVYKIAHGLALDQSGPMLVTVLIGGALPYLAGLYLFRFGKKVRVKPKA